ncbi:MAG: apolipoprotein N-acyltransferase [Xanthomonadales bacterium]|nr:apolipoprotein N-acyltransferase [Xanthomonadales bacterium]
MKTYPGERDASSSLQRFLGMVILPAFSGGLLAVAVTPDPNVALALVFLVPMFIGRPCGTLEAFVRGLMLGIAYYLGTVSWTLNVHGFEVWHLMPIVLYLSVSYGVWSIGLEMTRSESAYLQPAILASLWVVLEYVRNTVGFLALPWAGVAHGFLDAAELRQFAAVFGEYGLAFFAVFFSASLGRAISELGRGKPWAPSAKAVSVSLAFALSLFAFGFARLATLEPVDEISVRVVQAGKIDAGPPGQNSIESLAALSRIERDGDGGADLIVWPEGAVKLINRFPFVYGEIFQLSEELGAPIVFGASSGSKYLRRNSDQAAGQMINELVIIDGARDGLQKYAKRKLVPFGEYIPMAGRVDWPDWLVPEIIQVEVPPGPPQALAISSPEIAVVPAICWENIFAANIRSVVPAGAAVGVNISNLSIFASRKAAVQHNSSTVFRAIENGIAFVLATDTGPSWLVGPGGEIMASTAYGAPRSTQAVVPVFAERTLYWKIGDVLVFACAILLMGWAARRTLRGDDVGGPRAAERTRESGDSLDK